MFGMRFTALLAATTAALLGVAAMPAGAAPNSGKAPGCSLSVNGSVRNGSFEQTCPSDPGTPGGWQSVAFGPGAAGASFSSTAHPFQGRRAATTTVANDAVEAGWRTDLVSPRGGQRYRLHFEQSGTVYVYAYLAITSADGSTSFQSLMAAPATAGAWSLYQDWFVTPASVSSVQLTIATSGTGTVTIDNVALDTVANQQPVTFAAPMVSVSFDDGLASTYANGVPVLSQNHLTGTFFVNGATVNTPGYLTSAQVAQLAASGDEIGSHLYHHSDLVQLSPSTVRSELSGNVAAIQRMLGTKASVPGFASPYGSFTSGVVSQVLGYHRYQRDTDGRLNTKANLDAGQIHARTVSAGTTLTDVQAWLDEARQANAWLVLVYHGISDSTAPGSGDAGYDVTPSNFAAQMAALAGSGITVAPIYPALISLERQ